MRKAGLDRITVPKHVQFSVAVPTEAFTLSLLWHPRFAADPAHQWSRTLSREVCLDMQTDPISASGVHSNS
ncbi:hypothetical protein C4Q26_03040 [Pseudomonas sp. SWI44]|nr:hypothetical protein C4Q26_03040 [Pseudomonas sp. SWI44]